MQMPHLGLHFLSCNSILQSLLSVSSQLNPTVSLLMSAVSQQKPGQTEELARAPGSGTNHSDFSSQGQAHAWRHSALQSGCWGRDRLRLSKKSTVAPGFLPEPVITCKWSTAEDTMQNPRSVVGFSEHRMKLLCNQFFRVLLTVFPKLPLPCKEGKREGRSDEERNKEGKRLRKYTKIRLTL